MSKSIENLVSELEESLTSLIASSDVKLSKVLDGIHSYLIKIEGENLSYNEQVLSNLAQNWKTYDFVAEQAKSKLKGIKSKSKEIENMIKEIGENENLLKEIIGQLEKLEYTTPLEAYKMFTGRDFPVDDLGISKVTTSLFPALGAIRGKDWYTEKSLIGRIYALNETIQKSKINPAALSDLDELLKTYQPEPSKYNPNSKKDRKKRRNFLDSYLSMPLGLKIAVLALVVGMPLLTKVVLPSIENYQNRTPTPTELPWGEIPFPTETPVPVIPSVVPQSTSTSPADPLYFQMQTAIVVDCPGIRLEDPNCLETYDKNTDSRYQSNYSQFPTFRINIGAEMLLDQYNRPSGAYYSGDYTKVDNATVVALFEGKVIDDYLLSINTLGTREYKKIQVKGTTNGVKSTYDAENNWTLVEFDLGEIFPDYKNDGTNEFIIQPQFPALNSSGYYTVIEFGVKLDNQKVGVVGIDSEAENIQFGSPIDYSITCRKSITNFDLHVTRANAENPNLWACENMNDRSNASSFSTDLGKHPAIVLEFSARKIKDIQLLIEQGFEGNSTFEYYILNGNEVIDKGEIFSPYSRAKHLESWQIPINAETRGAPYPALWNLKDVVSGDIEKEATRIILVPKSAFPIAEQHTDNTITPENGSNVIYNINLYDLSQIPQSSNTEGFSAKALNLFGGLIGGIGSLFGLKKSNASHVKHADSQYFVLNNKSQIGSNDLAERTIFINKEELKSGILNLHGYGEIDLFNLFTRLNSVQQYYSIPESAKGENYFTFKQAVESEIGEAFRNDAYLRGFDFKLAIGRSNLFQILNQKQYNMENPIRRAIIPFVEPKSAIVPYENKPSAITHYVAPLQSNHLIALPNLKDHPAPTYLFSRCFPAEVVSTR